MKVLRVYDQYRRDCTCDLECEECGYKKTYRGAYDDRNFWDNVIPNYKCEQCGKSTKEISPQITQHIATKYPEGMRI